MQKGKFNTLCDSAWGSSAKGAASARLAEIYGVPNLSTCNYPNAGHTCIDGDVKFVSKVLPTGAILKRTRNLDLSLWIGPNSGFEREQLFKELQETGYSISDPKLHIHERAMQVEQRHKDAESPTGSQSTEHVSSTMSGAGAALTEKAMRRPEVMLARESLGPLATSSPMHFVRDMRKELSERRTFLHEVSQGWALSLNHGTHYPACTSRDCTPQQAFADFGILPGMIGDVYLNVRSFPIRVGNNFRDGVQTGYSGDCLYDQKETTWEEIGAAAEMPQSVIDQLAERERTTVTKKVRRCFTPSWQLLVDSAEFCGATKLILNFPQYIHWSAYQIRGGNEKLAGLHHKVRDYISTMEDMTGLPVVMIGTGADHDDYIFLE